MESAEQDEGHPGDLLGSFAEALADPGTQARAEPMLRRGKVLHADASLT